MIFDFTKKSKKSELEGHVRWLKDKAGIHVRTNHDVSMRAYYEPSIFVTIRRNGLQMVVLEFASSGHAIMHREREVLLNVEFESFSDISQEAWSVINRHLDDNVIQAMEEA